MAPPSATYTETVRSTPLPPLTADGQPEDVYTLEPGVSHDDAKGIGQLHPTRQVHTMLTAHRPSENDVPIAPKIHRQVRRA